MTGDSHNLKHLGDVMLTQHICSDMFQSEGLSCVKVALFSCQQSFNYVIIAYIIVLVAQFGLVEFQTTILIHKSKSLSL